MQDCIIPRKTDLEAQHSPGRNFEKEKANSAKIKIVNTKTKIKEGEKMPNKEP